MTVFCCFKLDMYECCNRVRIRFSVINSLFEDVFAQFENMEGGQEDTDDDASPHVRMCDKLKLELGRNPHCQRAPSSRH